MKKYSLLCVLSASLVSGSVLAETKETVVTPAVSNWTKVVTITTEADFVKRGDPQTLNLFPGFKNHYTVDHGNRAMADAGLFLGLEHKLGDAFAGQFGIAGYITAPGVMNGDVWQLGFLDNLQYSYQVNNQRLMLGGKILYLSQEMARPYVSAELGISFNNASNFQEKPIVPFAADIAAYRSRSIISFTWAVGFGVDLQLNNVARLGFGYQFGDLGRVALGTSPSQTTNQTITIGHLYMNQARMQFTYLI